MFVISHAIIAVAVAGAGQMRCRVTPVFCIYVVYMHHENHAASAIRDGFCSVTRQGIPAQHEDRISATEGGSSPVKKA